MKRIISLTIFFILFSSQILAFQEPYNITFPDTTECKEELNVVSREDSIRIILPEGKYCEDISTYLYVDETGCGAKNWKGSFSRSDEKHVTCTKTFVDLYNQICGERITSMVGSYTNKKWEIEFGYDDPPGGPYVKKISTKVLMADDVEEKCNQWIVENREKRIFGPLQVVGIIIALIGGLLDLKKKYRKIGFILNILGLLMGGIPILFNLFL